MIALTVRWADHVITPSNYVRQQLIDRFKIRPNKVTTTHEAAEPLATQSAVYRPMADQRYLLYVGNAYPYKNLTRLVEAFGQLNEPKLKLLLVGKTDYFYDQLGQHIKDQHLKNIELAGFVPDPQLVWLYEHAEFLVFPSLSEGFGLPPLEAMVAGLPVAAAKATCLPETLGQAAVYFDPDDTNDMVRVMRSLLDDSKARSALSRAGKQQAAKYSWSKLARQTLDIYQSLAG